MEITGKNGSIPLEAYTNNLKVRERAPSENATEGSGLPVATAQDKVVLSPRAREIAEAHKAANAAEDVRATKVDQLRQQIGGGTYRIDGDRIAIRMLKESVLNEIL